MNSNLKENLKTMVHPYIFVLKEGNGIGKGEDLIDYSLLMLKISSTEILASPLKQKTQPFAKPISIYPFP